MTSLTFTALDIVAEPYAAAPQLTARLRIEESTGAVIHAIALRCQVRIEPQRRPYSEADEAELLGLFGDRSRWRDTLRPFPWMQCAAMVQGFTGRPRSTCPCRAPTTSRSPARSTCTPYGTASSRCCCSSPAPSSPEAARGSASSRSGGTVRRRYQLPVSVWQQVIELNFPGTGWLRLDRDVLHALARYQAAHGLTTWDATIESLLAAAPPTPATVPEGVP